MQEQFLWFFWQGAIVGACIAIPVGPVALLCIRYAIAYGWLVGIIAGLGTALADGFYGGVAAFGASFVANLLPTHGRWFYLVAGGFLVFTGRKIFKSEISKDPKKIKEKSPYSKAFVSTLFLTFASPITTLVLASFFSREGFLENMTHKAGIPFLALGVAFGAFCWWVFLTGVVGYLRTKLNFRIFTFLNKFSGAAIFTYGVAAFVKFLMEIGVVPTLSIPFLS